MAKVKLSDLIPGLSAQDTSFDTDAPTIDIDPISNSKAGEARTFTLQQITQLCNVLLKRSNMQLRVTSN